MNMNRIIETSPHTKQFGEIHTEPYSFIVDDLISSPKHWQAEIEGAYIDSGWLEIFVKDRTYHLSQGDFVFIAEGIVHSFCKKSESGRVYVLKFQPEHVIKHGFSNETKMKISQLYQGFFITHSSDEIGRIVRQMNLADFGPYNECYICGKLLELTSHFLKHPEWIVTKHSGENQDSSKSLKLASDFIQTHIKEGISLEMLAEHLGFSSCYCSRYIKKKTGMTFVEYVNAARIAEAEALLLGSNDNITEIAYATGFSSMQTFNRVFKQIKNISPTEYRKLRKGKK